MIFFGVFEKFETFFSAICAHSERYRNVLAGIFEILTFMETSRFHSHRSKGSILFCRKRLGHTINAPGRLFTPQNHSAPSGVYSHYYYHVRTYHVTYFSHYGVDPDDRHIYMVEHRKKIVDI